MLTELSTLTPERVPTTLAQVAGWVTPLEENKSLCLSGNLEMKLSSLRSQTHEERGR